MLYDGSSRDRGGERRHTCISEDPGKKKDLCALELDIKQRKLLEQVFLNPSGPSHSSRVLSKSRRELSAT